MDRAARWLLQAAHHRGWTPPPRPPPTRRATAPHPSRRHARLRRQAEDLRREHVPGAPRHHTPRTRGRSARGTKRAPTVRASFGRRAGLPDERTEEVDRRAEEDDAESEDPARAFAPSVDPHEDAKIEADEIEDDRD